MAHDVFISYASSDKSTAGVVCDALESQGVRCWIAPRDIMAGQEYAGAIIDAISSSRVVVLVFSEHANNSVHISREVERAVSKGLPVLPYRIEDVRPARTLEYFLSSTHWIDASGNNPSAPQQLTNAVTQIVGRQVDHRQPSVFAARPGAKAVTTRRAGVLRKIVDLFRSLIAPRESVVLDIPESVAPGGNNSEHELAGRLTEQLSFHLLEDLAKFRVPQTLRADLATMIADLPVRLDRVAQQADQVLLLQDSGRRLETTETALRVLSDLQTELLNQPSVLGSAITNTTANWVSLFIAERDAARIELEDSRELENPFIFGNPVQQLGVGLFTGRRDIVLEIERSILCATQTPTLLLYGQRRMGKTSILNQLPALLGPHFLRVIVDCQAPAAVESQAALLRHLSRCLSFALSSRLGITHDDDETRRQRGVVPIPLEALRTDAFSIFEDWLDRFQSRLSDDTRVLLCLDEFERLQETIDAGWGTRFLDALRHWLQHRPRFALMFVGLHTFEQLGPVWTDRFLSARRLKVSFLGDDDVRQLLTRPTPTFRLAYANGALEAILAATHGQPFLTQVLASELVHHMNRIHKRQATPADVMAAIDDSLERSAEYFADLWFSRTDNERVMLCEVARGNILPPVSPVARGLRDYDVLDDSGNFSVPLVRLWVERNQLQT